MAYIRHNSGTIADHRGYRARDCEIIGRKGVGSGKCSPLLSYLVLMILTGLTIVLTVVLHDIFIQNDQWGTPVHG